MVLTKFYELQHPDASPNSIPLMSNVSWTSPFGDQTLVTQRKLLNFVPNYFHPPYDYLQSNSILSVPQSRMKQMTLSHYLDFILYPVQFIKKIMLTFPQKHSHFLSFLPPHSYFRSKVPVVLYIVETLKTTLHAALLYDTIIISLLNDFAYHSIEKSKY